MTEPPATAATLAGQAANGAISGAGIATAVPLDPITMAIGLVAAFAALLHIGPPAGTARTPMKVFVMVLTSGFLAGVFMPVAVAGGVNYLPWLAGAGDLALQYAAAAIIGAAPHVAPVLWRLWREHKGGA